MDDFGHGDRGGGSLHEVATVDANGFMSKEMVAELATVVAGGFTVAGTGLTASGTTINAIGNADGSIVANANDLQVGVLATDAQHGNRGNGALHTAATNAVAGFASAAQITALEAATALQHAALTLAAVGSSPNANGASLSGQALNLQPANGSHPGAMSAADFTKLAGVEALATATVAGTGLTSSGSTVNVIANADGSIVANANDIQVGVLATDAQHGVRGGGTQHDAATNAANGFATATQITKLEGIAERAPKNTYEFSAATSTTVNTLAFLYPAAATNLTVSTGNEIPLHQLMVSQACKVVSMHSYSALLGAGANGAAVTLRINGSASAMTFNHPNGAGATASTTSNQQTLAAWDRISVSFVTQTGLVSQYSGGIKVTLVVEAV